MAITNRDRVGKALDLLKEGLAPFVERELKAQDAQGWLAIARQSVGDTQAKLFMDDAAPRWDAQSLLTVMWNQWNVVFRKTLGQSERNLVSELRDVRNRWAHQEPFSGDDTDRALDSIARLLTAVSASQADDVGKMKQDLRRLVYEEQVRGEKRRVGGSLIEAAATGALKPWREVVTPHPDVASGRYQQAEFAADLWQVHLGEGSDEYRKPAEFFRRTFLTESLKQLLVDGAERLNGRGGSPVVQLQTNFGGGKTHSMLALYHLFSGVAPADLPGVDQMLAAAKVTTVPKAKRVVLVGNKISPGNPVTKDDGTVVRTLWGELAWQLGGRKAFERVRLDDERATSPGDVLRELFVEYGPCLVLIDEWVAYARQLHDQSDLPGGGFETQFSFAQALTESAKLAGNCLLVVSLPASDTSGSPSAQVDDVEVGGVRGREALDRLRNVVGRLESSWRPATAEEGFEIVRRRLFEPLAGPEAFKLRDLTARACTEYYQQHADQFPTDCRTADYERRIQAAYPIHPEIFDQLYGGWSTLVKFQRTRGVLRLMAAVVHALWEKGDRSPLVMPATIPIDEPRVQFELTRYLSDNWAPIIEKDVDGPASLPLRLDAELPALGRLSAARRVARTIYLGSAPTASAAQRGIEDRHIKLGAALPGESPAAFGDAMRYLAGKATFLYQDSNRYWYSTQPTVTKMAEDRAEQLKRDADRVIHAIEERLQGDLKFAGEFSRVHVAPRSGGDVADELETRLVVLSPEHAYGREAGSPAQAAAQAILETRGSAPRLYRNTLVFLAADRSRLQDLEEAVRKQIAWRSIVDEKTQLDLTPHQVRQAESQLQAADGAVRARLPEVYQWLLVPTQSDTRAPMEWTALKLTSGEGLAARAAKKLRSDELLVANLAGTMLRHHLDRVPLWRGDHVTVRQLVEDFASYPYLPRLAGPGVLLQAVQAGVSQLTWRTDTFAFADGWDDEKSRYRGLIGGRSVHVTEDGPGLLVKPDVAGRQLEAELSTPAVLTTGGANPVAPVTGGGEPVVAPPTPSAPKATRYFGSVVLDSERVGRDASRIADEVVSHLASLVGAKVKVTLEIEADLPDGVSDTVTRIVLENGRTLKFGAQGFE
jgi:predicted AAA+ superfamily ATPase